MTILVIDDEDTLRYFLRLNLESNGYDVLEASDGKTAFELIAQHEFEVALVDLKLTDMNGLEIVQELRQKSPHTAIIVLTAHASLDSAIEALQYGALDYLIKPCGVSKLLETIAKGVRYYLDERKNVLHDKPILTIQDLVLNQVERKLIRGGQAIHLTATEFNLLANLMVEPDVAIDAKTLIKQIRGYEATDARAIARVHIHRLRHKLEDNINNPKYIKTVSGGRYLISSEA